LQLPPSPISTPSAPTTVTTTNKTTTILPPTIEENINGLDENTFNTSIVSAPKKNQPSAKELQAYQTCTPNRKTTTRWKMMIMTILAVEDTSDHDVLFHDTTTTTTSTMPIIAHLVFTCQFLFSVSTVLVSIDMGCKLHMFG
jgi:hypothetical protein